MNRLIDLFDPQQADQIRAQLAASLAAVVWQQLLPCKEEAGLVLACEVLIATPSVRALIRHGRTHEILSTIQTGQRYGMCSMEQSIEDLVQRGIVESTCLDHMNTR